jgi:hypothetical protein
MPKIKSRPFVEYSFTEEELVVASVFTELQTAYIETTLSYSALEKANLAYTAGMVDSERLFIYQQEYLRGKMEALQELLNISEDRKLALQELYSRSSSLQQMENSALPNDLNTLPN